MANDADRNATVAEPDGVALRRSQLSPLAAFVAMLVAGFIPLLILQLSGRWSTQPDLFAYRSATVGDGLLLPLFAAYLVAARARLPRVGRERPLALGGALAGAAGAGVIQWRWYHDPHPDTNWTMPRAHTLTLPGYWHTAFFVAAASLLGALLVTVIARLARAPTSRRLELAQSSLLFAVLLTGLGYIGLAVVDDVSAAHTQAGQATAAGIGVGFVLSGALLASLGRALRRAFRPLFAAGSAAVGLALLADFGLPHVARSIAGGLIVILLVVGLGAEVIVKRGRALIRPRSLGDVASLDGAGRLVATSLILFGALAFALGRVETAANEAALALVIAAVCAVILNPVGEVSLDELSLGDSFLLVVACAYTIGLVVLADWLEHHATTFAANYALGFSAFFVDGLVVGLIRARFQDVLDVDRQPRASGAPAPEEVGPAVLIQIAGLGGAAIGGLLLLYVEAAPILGLDRGTVSFPISLGAWSAIEVVALGIAIASLLVARGRVRRLPDVDFDQPIQTDAWATALGLLALATSVAPLLLLSPASARVAASLVPSTYSFIGLAGGVALACLTVEDVIWTGGKLHLRRLDVAGWTLGLGVALVVGLMQWWVVTTGLWGPGGRPLSALWMFATSFALPLVITLVCVFALTPVAFGLKTEERLTAQETVWNLVLTRILYSFLGFLACTVVVLAIGRLRLVRPSDAGLVAISSLAIMPSLVGAFLWVLGNNVAHLRGQEGKIPVGLEDLQKTDPALTDRLNCRRLDELALHTRRQNKAAIAAFAGAGLWLAWHLLR